MLQRNIVIACVFYCSSMYPQSKKRDPFNCAHKHGTFQVAYVGPVPKKTTDLNTARPAVSAEALCEGWELVEGNVQSIQKQTPSGWQVIEQNGSEVIMQDPQGHIRKISLAK